MFSCERTRQLILITLTHTVLILILILLLLSLSSQVRLNVTSLFQQYSTVDQTDSLTVDCI